MNSIIRVVLSVIVGLCLASSVMGATPQIMNFQGKLTDTSGHYLDGQYNLTFRIYDRETGGAVLWQESHAAANVTRGIFSVPLGAGTPLNLPFNTNYWVSIQVATDAEMSPRQRLTAAPYAFRSAKSDYADVAAYAEAAANATLAQTAVTAQVAVVTLSGGVPTGTVLPYAGTNAPSGFFLCDGAPLSSFTYPGLFAVIGTTWGAGDGSLDEYGRVRNFNLPDLRGRVVAGKDAGQSEFNALGKTGGEKSHVLTIAETPAHTHGTRYGGPTDGTLYPETPYISDLNAGPGQNTGSTGGGQAHNTLPPYGVVNYIIKH